MGVSESWGKQKGQVRGHTGRRKGISTNEDKMKKKRKEKPGNKVQSQEEDTT